MTQAIPVSQIVTVNPSVVGAGGNPLSLNAIFVDNDARTPISSLLTFTTADAVAEYFGVTSTQKELADVYFAGFDISTKKPGTLFFAGYASTARAAWLRGQSLAGMTLTELQDIMGALSITVDGVNYVGAIDLHTATSFTDAASLMTTVMAFAGAATITWDPLFSQFVVTSGTTGATSTMSQGEGAAAPLLGLSAGTLSQGAAADTPTSAMARIKPLSQNWATFMTTFEPALDDKKLFAAWTSAENLRYAYVCWDTDAGYATSNNATVFGSIVDQMNYEGVVVVYNTVQVAAFVCGYAGSIDFQAINGRATPAFKSQSGLATTVDTQSLADAVLSNNASYYGLYQAPGSGNIYSILYDGRMNGSNFRWLDTFLNQIYLNAQLQLAIFEGLKASNAVPYNSQGETLIRAWCADPIAEALNNGTIRTGVDLSNSQIATIAMQAGLDISTQLQTQGYYLQILPATAQVRAGRQSPPVKLFYLDGGAIQQITLASIAVL